MDDLGLQAPSDEARQPDQQVDVEVVHDPGGPIVSRDREELVLAAHAFEEVTLNESPGDAEWVGSVVVTQRVFGASPHGRGTKGHIARTALIIADKDRCLLDVWGPLRQAFDVKHRLVAVPRRGPHDRVLAGVIGHRRPPLARTLPVVELAVAFPLAIHNRSSASLIPERSRAASTS